MNNDVVNFRNGGYQGDATEQLSEQYTKGRMPFWWQFREVLRASDKVSETWKKIDGSNLTDEAQKELIAISLLNYAVNTGMTEALAFLKQVEISLNQTDLHPMIVRFHVLKDWKALYSSLYSSYNALCNIAYVLVTMKSPFGDNPDESVWNYTPSKTLNKVQSLGLQLLYAPLKRCNDYLEIRSHLDHFWTIWHSVDHHTFYIDKHFRKGYVPLRPKIEVETRTDAYALASDHIAAMAMDFNIVYKQFAVTGGLLDGYLAAKEIVVDYAGFEPHYGKRPVP